VLDIKLVIF